MSILAEASGWVGAVAVLAGYLLFSFGWITSARAFQAYNLAGAAALLVNAYYHEAWPSVALNIAWGGISGVAILRLRKASRRASSPSDEEALSRQ
ncbi:MAG TPA: hypothetical protein VJQ61_14305 [Sinomonas sp.]|nr:hypothetical protein [Sinomonas sp.]